MLSFHSLFIVMITGFKHFTEVKFYKVIFQLNFYLSWRASVTLFSLVRREFWLAPENRRNYVNVESCILSTQLKSDCYMMSRRSSVADSQDPSYSAHLPSKGIGVTFNTFPCKIVSAGKYFLSNCFRGKYLIVKFRPLPWIFFRNIKIVKSKCLKGVYFEGNC